jgi:PAS domain S-box-containing protein
MRGDGSKVHVDILLSPLKDDSGSVTHVVEAIRDVTDLIQAYEALQESEEKYRLLVENANEAIFVIQDGMLRFFNIKNIELIGYSKEELTSTPFINFVHPDDREVTLGRHLKRIRGEELPGVNVFRIIDKAGNIKWAEVNSVLISWEGRPAILNFLNDITERKQAEGALRQSEEKYRNVLENIEDGYYEVDIAGNFTFFNDSMCQIYGYPREELMGMSDRQYTDQENAKKLFQAFNKVYRTGESTEELDWEIIRKDGARRSIEASVSLIEDSSGNRIGFRGLIRDVTERKRAEEEKATLQEQLRQSQKIEAIGRLAGGIAHDFNNLLTVIKGYSQLSLIELKEGDPLKGNIEEVKKAADRAADLTRQLLAFSRRQILEMRVLDLNTVLRDLDKMLHRLIGEDIELVTVFTDDLGRVKTDPGWVEQIIMNLAVNARDAMPSVGKLTIETANVELDGAYARDHIAVTPGRYVMLSVSDTGVGMTPEVRQQVFEPFFTTKEKGKGTGLGLSTVYGIVKQSGGNIWVYSEPGQGTTFKIYLPRVDEPLEEIKERVVKEELPHGSETILVVEDEEEVRKLAVRILQRQGYTVLDAPDGDGALVICGERKDPIHLILTDVVMPGMSGRQLADRLGSFHPEMKVLYMSGYTDNAITHHGVLEKGMNYIQKPFTVDGLIRKVREVLDKGSKPAA